MFEIPVDIPEAVSPLAWLLGRWQGWGTRSLAGSPPASLVGQSDVQNVGQSTTQVDSRSDARVAGQSDSQNNAQVASQSDTKAGLAGRGEAPILHDLVFAVDGDRVKQTHSWYEAVADGDYDPLWSAEQGLTHLVAGELLGEETVWWRVDSASIARSHMVIDPSVQPEFDLESESTDSFGLLTSWTGLAIGPRISLRSQKISRQKTAVRQTVAVQVAEAVDAAAGNADTGDPDAGNLEIVSRERMFGLVAGELMFAYDVQLAQGEGYTEFTGRLQRVEMAGS